MTLPRRVVIATAGHVDHGKTTLIRALTGVDTDRLPDEKRRGISIELGFAELPGEALSFIDVPGHKKLVHAMIAGAHGVDGVLLVVAADDAVMPQTREHLWVCALLGVTRVVVALTKADLVDAETLELAQADVEATLESVGLAAQAIVATSGTKGTGIDALRDALLQLGHGAPPVGDSARVWLPIDRVFSIKGAGTVITGTLTRGELSVGQPLWVASGSGRRETQCRGLEVHGKAVEKLAAPSRVAVNLARVDLPEVARGDVVCADAELPISRRLDVSLTALPGSEKSLAKGKPVLVYVGTDRRTARITRFDEATAHLSLEAPLPVQGRTPYVLRGFRSTRDHGAVLGGGRILDADAPPLPRRRDQGRWLRRAETLAALAADDAPGALSGLLALAAPRALDVPAVERRLGVEPGALLSRLSGKKKKGSLDAIALPGGTEFVMPETLAQLIERLVARVRAHHAAAPHDAGLSLETARTELARTSGRALADLVLERAVKEKRLLSEQATVCTPEFAESAGPGARRAQAALLDALTTVGLEGATDAALIAATGERPEMVKSGLARLATEDKARRLSNLWFAESALDALRDRVRQFFAAREVMSVPEFKDLAGVSRKQAIPLLEQLDREGTTRRQGDLRSAGARLER